MNKPQILKTFLVMIKRLAIAEDNKLAGYQKENRQVVAVQIFNTSYLKLLA